MKIAIWGTGLNAARCFLGMETKADFFIEQNKEKKGTYLGRPVIHPNDINVWKGTFVYVPKNYYEEISVFLIEQGMKENLDFIEYDGNLRISSSRAMTDLNVKIEKLKKVSNTWKEKPLFLSFPFYLRTTYVNYSVYLLKNVDLNFISDSLWENKDINTGLYFEPEVLEAPLVWWQRCIVEDGHLSEFQKKQIDSDSCLNGVIEQMKKNFFLHCTDGIYYWLNCIMKYIEAVLNFISPSMIFCLDSVRPAHVVLKKVCKEAQIPVIFTHPGILPGTLAFDIDGEMGESLPNVYSDRFMKLPISDADVVHARNVWKYLYKSKLNRKIQPKTDCIAVIRKRIVSGRPIVFFAGQNDPHSQMIPYNHTVKRYHSPIFESSLAAAQYLAEICCKNRWNFVYKSHPQYFSPNVRKQLPSNTIFFEFGDINDIIDISDVTVTILSSTNYNALIRYKPVVMLGYNQTRGKGCTYEAFEKDKIEDTIKEALEKGFTKEQQDAFLKHIAQCLKYYLYDDLQDRPIRYGRPVPKSIDEFYELERLLKKEDGGGKIT